MGKGRKHNISIALCTFNGARYLQAQLESLRNQTRQPDEVVLCDDGSTDETMSIAKDFSRFAPFSVTIAQNSTTLGSTRNFDQALRLCTRDLIGLCDQDDVWLPRKLEMLEMEFVRTPETDAVFTDACVVDENLASLGYRLWDVVKFSPSERHMVHKRRLLDVLLRHNVVTGATLLFKSEWRDIVLPIPAWDIHDAWIALLVAAMGDVRALDEPLVLYRQHQANQIGGRRNGLRYRLGRPIEAPNRESMRVLRRFEAAKDRIVDRSTGDRRARLIQAFDEKISHLQNRIRFSNNELGSFKVFAKDLARGAYHKYSIGWWSVAHDIFNRIRARSLQ